jgi:hypothetical protein
MFALSGVTNVLYIAGLLSEAIADIGPIFVMLFCSVSAIYNAKFPVRAADDGEPDKDESAAKKRKTIPSLLAFFGVFWVVTYIIALFR